MEIKQWHHIKNLLLTHFQSGYRAINKTHISEALFIILEEEYQMECPVDLLFIDLEYDKAYKLLTEFDFNPLLNKIETEEEIIPKNLLIDVKGRFKSSGINWVIHQSDPDYFPSKPHAHQLENNIKLDLGNGRCYRCRKLIHTIPRKELLDIRAKASKVYNGDLPALQV